ncbi:Transposase IS116/IS110/IS902 family protein (plasmid) [Acidiphilium sp. PM]|nr:Transposase IS116/IS110/IS902 family protein [Acidiphilium sp. PM]
MEYKRISIDTSKHVFTIHAVDEKERPVLRHDLGRAQIERFFARLAPTEVALEACAGAHHWGRRLIALGHQVKLIHPDFELVTHGPRSSLPSIGIISHACGPDSSARETLSGSRAMTVR